MKQRIQTKFNRLAGKLLPGALVNGVSIVRTLDTVYGRRRSLHAGQCVDERGQPIPWYTYPCLDYLRSLDWSGCHVFEYGSGGSSRFWASRAGSVTAVEHDSQWFDRGVSQAPDNLTMRLETDPSAYAKAVGARPEWDIVVIDGWQEHRVACAQAAITHVSTAGVVIVDNSDRFPDVAKMFRDAGFIQVDFHGFGPLNRYPWCTSVLMASEFRPRPASGHLPVKSHRSPSGRR